MGGEEEGRTREEEGDGDSAGNAHGDCKECRGDHHVLRDMNHTQKRLRVEEEEKNKLEGEVEALRAGNCKSREDGEGGGRCGDGGHWHSISQAHGRRCNKHTDEDENLYAASSANRSEGAQKVPVVNTRVFRGFGATSL